MAIKVKNLKKEKKTTERKKKTGKTLGEPIDVKGIAGGQEDCPHSMVVAVRK
jgi:hypothetical protein